MNRKEDWRKSLIWHINWLSFTLNFIVSSILLRSFGVEQNGMPEKIVSILLLLFEMYHQLHWIQYHQFLSIVIIITVFVLSKLMIWGWIMERVLLLNEFIRVIDKLLIKLNDKIFYFYFYLWILAT